LNAEPSGRMKIAALFQSFPVALLSTGEAS